MLGSYLKFIMRPFHFITTLLSICFLFFAVRTNARQDGGRKKAKRENTGHSQNCDIKLWNHVYNPNRLEVIDACKEVTGVIDEMHKEPDGDQHMLLRLDEGQQYLLKKRNLEKKNGELVIEIVCANKVKDKKARGACVNYSTPLPLPRMGAHVRVTGSYVLDTHNGWTEIHPVSKIEEIR
jgi:hypothetical protein